MTEWQEKQHNEQKRQCKCRYDADGKRVSKCKNCRDFDSTVEGDYEEDVTVNFEA